MRHRIPAIFLAALPLLCSCASQRLSSIHTYADLEAETRRTTVRYLSSQLTSKPQQTLDTLDLAYGLFFQLPLRERVVYVMDSFANYDLDGENAEVMWAMLCNRNKPATGAGWPFPHPRPAEDIAYTNAIFHTIDSFSDAQVREFCRGPEQYKRFWKNLKFWKGECGYKPAHDVAGG